ncbi:AGE family epimerase/isomerase [Sediminispirochaeta bajacaliforniensis]|uniref:AGE family epimerase/isomerase n=1 Tax=Sediminispirochaeta bajacaliforniensis TaxID=148 RepID=UPI0003641D47|nr:AGE family epimerase/isomerase [Sediminispirochaeta bajacaliforniensis]
MNTIHTKEAIRNYLETCTTQLYDNILPFWLQNAPDTKHGGFFHQFDRNGSLNSQEKGIWVQGRFTWLLSWLGNNAGSEKERSRYLGLAETGARFLLDHAIAPNGRCYYLLGRSGEPLRQRRYLFSEVFTALGLHAYGSVAGDKESVEQAKRLIEVIEHYLAHPELLESKYLPGVVSLRSHSMTMIMINLFQQMRSQSTNDEVKTGLTKRIEKQIDEFLRYFFHPSEEVVLEFSGPEGEIVDTPAGREINPGHSLETAWFLMEEYRYSKNHLYLDRAMKIIDWAFARGWDTRYGGFFSFLDLYDHDSPHIEATMKYWWPHTEALYASLLAYALSGKESYADYFLQVADYLFGSFPDPDYPEWFGYLSRDGVPTSGAKGNLWKGPFHIPRSLKLCLELRPLLDL